MLTNNDLGGDLTLIYEYNRRKRALESDFSERAKRLDAEFTGKVGKCAGAELDQLVQAKLKVNQNMTYSAAFSEVQQENPKLVSEYIQELP